MRPSLKCTVVPVPPPDYPTMRRVPFLPMIAHSAQAAVLSKPGLSRVSAVTRAIVTHERSLAFLCALATAGVAFQPRIRAGGLLVDDWALYADVRFPTAVGSHSALGALGSSAGSRLGAMLYWLAGFSVFGSHTRLYLLTAALLAVVMAFSIYVLLRELRFPIPHSLAMMVLTIAAPSVETVRFWFTPSGSQISLTLFFFGLTLALRALSAPTAHRTRLHFASWSLYLLSALYAEVALPLIGACVLVYFTRARVATSLRRWAFDLIIVIVGYLATVSFVDANKGFVKLPRSMWGEHTRLLGDQALTIFTRMLGSSAEGARQPALIVLGVLGVTGVVVARSRRTRAGARHELQRWALAFLVSLVAIVACYATYIPAMLYYEPLSPGLGNHINIVIAAPLAVGVFAVLMFARVVIAEVLKRRRPRVRQFATVLVTAWFVLILVNGVRDVRSDAHIWAIAASRDREVLKTLTTHLARPVHGSTVYTFGEAGTVAPGLPIFFSYFELSNAVKIAYRRGDVSAYPVVTEDDTVDCTPGGITVDVGAIKLNHPSPYGQSYFFDVPSGSYERVVNATACTAALSRFHPGPYSATTLEWSR